MNHRYHSAVQTPSETAGSSLGLFPVNILPRRVASAMTNWSAPGCPRACVPSWKLTGRFDIRSSSYYYLIRISILTHDTLSAPYVRMRTGWLDHCRIRISNCHRFGTFLDSLMRFTYYKELPAVIKGKLVCLTDFTWAF